LESLHPRIKKPRFAAGFFVSEDTLCSEVLLALRGLEHALDALRIGLAGLLRFASRLQRLVGSLLGIVGSGLGSFRLAVGLLNLVHASVACATGHDDQRASDNRGSKYSFHHLFYYLSGITKLQVPLARSTTSYHSCRSNCIISSLLD